MPIEWPFGTINDSFYWRDHGYSYEKRMDIISQLVKANIAFMENF